MSQTLGGTASAGYGGCVLPADPPLQVIFTARDALWPMSKKFQAASTNPGY
jgi:hypothetical protein